MESSLMSSTIKSPIMVTTECQVTAKLAVMVKKSWPTVARESAIFRSFSRQSIRAQNMAEQRIEGSMFLTVSGYRGYELNSSFIHSFFLITNSTIRGLSIQYRREPMVSACQSATAVMVRRYIFGCDSELNHNSPSTKATISAYETRSIPFVVSTYERNA